MSARSAPRIARNHALVFEARVGDKQLEGCDFIQLDDDGAIKELTVMVRPLSRHSALAEAMKARLAAMDATERATGLTT